ncbi:hypothetical protein CWI39_1741p0010 [Hamiltosporidium magnivora]|uniref:Leucine-rich repeat-containing protein n=1 Tax=Hamiltosporidium magnivora TaxID=148818 RepID=A0A4Q9KZZ4_9MICR|nr:hypothetical protein CWI39_1741p0010 [Hamiltosporidium magnivora]
MNEYKKNGFVLLLKLNDLLDYYISISTLIRNLKYSIYKNVLTRVEIKGIWIRDLYNVFADFPSLKCLEISSYKRFRYFSKGLNRFLQHLDELIIKNTPMHIYDIQSLLPSNIKKLSLCGCKLSNFYFMACESPDFYKSFKNIHVLNEICMRPSLNYYQDPGVAFSSNLKYMNILDSDVNITNIFAKNSSNIRNLEVLKVNIFKIMRKF